MARARESSISGRNVIPVAYVVRKFLEDEHYYLDTENDFGYIIELGNAGRIPARERRYPE